MKKSTTAKALKENLKGLTSTTRSKKKSNVSSTRKTQTTKGKTTSKSTTTQRAKAGTSTTRSSKITITQSRKKDLFPHMGIAHKFPYYFEPMPEIADRLNKAWFDQYFGEERMKDHIRKHKLKSHQYKAYVNYWWLKETSKNSVT